MLGRPLPKQLSLKVSLCKATNNSCSWTETFRKPQFIILLWYKQYQHEVQEVGPHLVCYGFNVRDLC